MILQKSSIMAGEDMVVDICPTSQIVLLPDPESDDFTDSESSRLNEERLCPLCRSPVRFFFIKWDEQLLMCENPLCDFPFGCEVLQLQQVETAPIEEYCDVISTINTIIPISSIEKTYGSPSTGIANVAHESSKDISRKQIEPANTDIVKITKESKDPPVKKPKQFSKEYKLQQMEEAAVNEKLNDLRKLTVQLSEDDTPKQKVQSISNQKWIKNLWNLQDISGVQLLKPDEMSLLKREEVELGLSELKIDINPGNNANNNVSIINIQIHNVNEASRRAQPTENNIVDVEMIEQRGSEPIEANGQDPLPV